MPDMPIVDIEANIPDWVEFGNPFIRDVNFEPNLVFRGRGPRPIALDDIGFPPRGLRPPMPAGPRADNGPKLWDKILFAVNEIYEPEYVCVAGGAVRDYEMGEQAKDIDVFLRLRDDKLDLKDFMEKAQELGFQNVRQANRVDPYLKDNKRGLTQCVVKCIVEGWNVDLVITKCKTGEELVKTSFDFRINEFWYDGEIRSTNAAIFDKNKRQWTPSRALTADTKAHFERVNQRLGGKYKINTGDPWYMKFQGKEKIK